MYASFVTEYNAQRHIVDAAAGRGAVRCGKAAGGDGKVLQLDGRIVVRQIIEQAQKIACLARAAEGHIGGLEVAGLVIVGYKVSGKELLQQGIACGGGVHLIRRDGGRSAAGGAGLCPACVPAM